MTDAKQTKCPHCGSTFRISDAQLAAKGGNVRCGSCLQVFRADLHLVGATPAPAAARPAAPVAKPGKKAVDESWAHDLAKKEGGATDDWTLPDGDAEASDDFGFSDDDISDFMTKGKAAPSDAAAGKTILFDDELSDQLDEAGSNLLGDETEETHRLSDNADESWAKDILSELETEQQKEEKKKYSMELVDDKPKPSSKNPKLAAALGQTPPAAKPTERAPEAPADDFLGNDADVLSFLDNDDLSQPAAAAPSTLAPDNPFSLDRPLAHVDAPVELKPHREPVRWGYVIGWTFMCLLALSLLVAQYIFFNLNSLAINPLARPALEEFCAQAGCRLPEVPDPSKLKVEDLVVRKHPQQEDALIVDAIVKNSASFPQPFPLLRLRFSNNADEIIASRVLKPAEYLQGEARLLRRIPPDTPVRISLEIVDPGPEAIAYGLDPLL